PTPRPRARARTRRLTAASLTCRDAAPQSRWRCRRAGESTRARTPSASRTLPIFRTPPQQPPLELLDAERHHDADHAEGNERDHHIGGVQRSERLDDQVAETTARLATQELPDHYADQRERNRWGEGREGPGQGRRNDDRPHNL